MKIVLTLATSHECPQSRLLSRFVPGLHVVSTGIGLRRPADELQRLLSTPADLCIASGLAGSLKTHHPVGSVLVARGVKTESNETILSSDGALVDHAARQGAKPVDFFYTSKTVVNSPAERSRLATIADAVDMESFSVLAEADRVGVPAVAVRAISDSPVSPLPLDFERAIDKQGELNWLAVAAEVAKQPTRVAGLVKFGIRSSHASRNLAKFL